MIAFADCIPSSEGTVKKYVYADDSALVESVIYRYPDYETRTVLCVSVQSGCRVGCAFCGTGRHFFRNLTANEIVLQVTETLARENVDATHVNKLQIMFMSMGEPSHNWDAVETAIRLLHDRYPTAQLLVSTVGTNERAFQAGIIALSREIDAIGLQFSIHHGTDEERNHLIPYEDKMTLAEIAAFGERWHEATGRHPYCNYVVTPSSADAAERLFDAFNPRVFCFTFSVLCSPEESVKSATVNHRALVERVSKRFLERGYDVRVFDPAGQDDIGGGCGQLWYFQERVRATEANKSINPNN